MASNGKQSGLNYYLFWALGVVIYLVLTAVSPVSGNTYNLSTFAITALKFSLVIPIAAIWWVAVFGAHRFKIYAFSICDSPDGKALNTVANGLIALIYGTILSSIVTSALTFQAHSIHFRTYSHVSVILQWLSYLVAFTLIYLGSRGLAASVSDAPERTPYVWLVIPYLAVASWYSYAMLHNPYRTQSPDPSVHMSFYLTDIWLILLVIVPYLLIWGLGFFAISNMANYQRKVKGAIYKHALSRLTYGIVAVILFSISIQLLGTAGDSLNGLNLATILVFIYAIILFYSIGYLIIASGAKRLSKLEDV